VRYICVFQGEKAKISKIPTSQKEVRNVLFILFPGEIERRVGGVAKYKNPLLMHAMSSLGMPDQ
jgi:ABC-type phosphonate transport system ATPase subunit